jgi:hypothetical protein
MTYRVTRRARFFLACIAEAEEEHMGGGTSFSYTCFDLISDRAWMSLRAHVTQSVLNPRLLT